MTASGDQPISSLLREYLGTLIFVFRWRLVVSLALMLTLSALQGVGVLMLVPLLGFIGLNEASGAAAGIGTRIGELFRILGLPETLPSVLGVFLVLVCLREGLLCFHTVRAATIQQGLIQCLQERLYRAITYSNWLFFTRTRPSDFIQALTGDIGRIGQGTHFLLELVSNGVTLGLFALMALWLSPLTAAVTVVCGLVVLFLMRPSVRQAQPSGRALTLTARRLFAAIGEHLGGMKVAKSFGGEARHVEQFVRLVGDTRTVHLDFIRNKTRTKMWFFIGSATILCCCLYAAVEVFAEPPVSLLLLVFVFARMMPLTARTQQSYQELLHMLPAFAAFRDMEARCKEAAEDSPEGGLDPIGFSREFRLRRIRFSYHPGQNLLGEVDLVIPAQRTTALVGPSGSGKSTIADLLMGLLQPDSGEIEVDGYSLSSADLPAWRRGIGYVPQEVFLFHDTVRANLLWACPEAEESEVWQALERAAADFVRQLPQGLETEIGERGVRLSGGERQRLALARALLIRPKLLILDEATSNLDVENERRIQRALAELRGQMTIVIIAHRLSSIRNADQIVVVEAGGIVECGSWEELHGRIDSRLAALS